MSNFWSTWEVYCYSAGFQYEQYLEEHPGPCAPLCVEAFKALCAALDIQLEKDLAGNETSSPA